MTRVDRGPGSFAEGGHVSFDTGKRGVQRGVLVEFRGSRWVVRTADARTWRVPATMLAAYGSDVAPSRDLLAEGQEALAERDAKRNDFKAQAGRLLAPQAERFEPGQIVDVVHRGAWGWSAVVVSVDVPAGKVTVTNPTRELLARFSALGVIVPDRRTTRTVTLWANRVREKR